VKNKIYNPLNVTARLLGLPAPYIKELAQQGKIPFLKIRNRLRFNPEAVQEALDEIAANKGDNDEK